MEQYTIVNSIEKEKRCGFSIIFTVPDDAVCFFSLEVQISIEPL